MPKKQYLTAALENELAAAAEQSDEDCYSDIDDHAQVQDEQAEEIAETIGAADSLDNLLAAVEQPAGTAGETSNPTAERILAVAVEHIFERLGQPMPRSLGLESDSALNFNFKDKIKRAKELLIKMWEKIVEMFTRIYESVTDWLSTAFNAAERLERQAIALLKESRAINGPPARSTYTSREMARKLAGDDTVGTIKLYDRTLELTKITIATAYAEPARLLSELINEYTSLVKNAKSDAAAATKATQTIEKLPKVLFAAYTSRLMSLSHPNSPVSGGYSVEGVDVYTTPILLGDKIAAVAIPKTGADLAKFDFSIVTLEDDSGNALSSEVPIADVREQGQLLKMVIDNSSYIRKFNKSLASLHKLDQDLHAALATLKSQSSLGTDEATDKTEHTIMKTLAYAAPKIAQGIHAKAFAFSLNSSRTVLEHVRHSIKAYEGNRLHEEAGALARI